MPPTLVFVIGPPAVGKMTVGREIAARTGFRLFHNHHTIDLVLEYFPYGSPPFRRLVSEFRRRILEEAATSELAGHGFLFPPRAVTMLISIALVTLDVMIASRYYLL